MGSEVYMPVVIIAAILIAILVAYLKSPKSRGRRGENRVKFVVGDTKEGKKYVINNLTFLNNGKSCQIDHIVINPKGIFVIETKNYSGRIYGSENQLEWTQVLSYGKVKNKFYNPLKQNATHVYNVKGIVGNLPIYSLVVFVQNNTHYIDAPNVIPLQWLRRELNKGADVLSVEQMKKAYGLLVASNQDISTKQHVQSIKVQVENINNGICPRCGGKLVKRNGKYGEFWGCENYPKCKFIKNK